VFPQANIQMIQVWWAWKPCSGSCTIYPLLMVGIWHLAQHSWNVPEHHSAFTTCMLWLPLVHLPVALADKCEKKTWEWPPVSQCCKMYASAKHLQTVLAHTLLLNCCWCLLSIHSARIHRLNVSWHLLVCGTCTQHLSPPFSYIICIRKHWILC
jgi:hypothetical protein